MLREGTGDVLRRIFDAPVPGMRWRERQETGWKDSWKRYMESVCLKEDVLGRTKWKNDIQNHSGKPRYTGNERGEACRSDRAMRVVCAPSRNHSSTKVVPHLLVRLSAD